MVVFSCDGCGEVLKKNQVDAHAYRCRKCDSVSCADCGVSFFGDDYRLHTTCMTEAERYEKSVYQPSNKQKKKNPQEVWMDLIQQSVSTAPVTIRNSIQHLADLGNVPRKEKQFRNFAANSLNLRGRQTEIVNEIWKFLSAKRAKENEEKKKREEELLAQKRKQKEEQEKKEAEAAANAKAPSSSPEKKDNDNLSAKHVRKTAKKILKKGKSSMKVKHLRAKVLEALGLDKSLQKKLKKMLKNELVDGSKFKIDGKMVRLAD